MDFCGRPSSISIGLSSDFMLPAILSSCKMIAASSLNGAVHAAVMETQN